MDTQDLQIIQKIRGFLSWNPIVWDIGANHGEYTDFVIGIIPMAKMFLFEPNLVCYEKICTKYLTHRNVFTFPFMIGEKDGKAPFYHFDDYNDQLSSRYYRKAFMENPSLVATYERKDTHCVDKLIIRDVGIDFMKVDVEGSEFDVLKGAQQSMTNRLISFIQVEYGETYIDAGITMREVIEFANILGYKVYKLDGGFIEITSEFFVEDYHYENYLITYRDMK